MGRETDNEMRQIQQGLEAFLQQELQEMELEAGQQRTPQARGIRSSQGMGEARGMQASQGMGDSQRMRNFPGTGDSRRMRDSQEMRDSRRMWDFPGTGDSQRMRDSQEMGNSRRMRDFQGMRGSRQMQDSEELWDSQDMSDSEEPWDSQEMQDSRGQWVPRQYTVEEEYETERELDIIGNTSGRERVPAKKRAREDYYAEDWDSPERAVRGKQRNRQGAPSGRRSAGAASEGPAKDSRKPNGNGTQEETVKRQKRRPGKKRGSGLKKLLLTAVLLIALVAGGLYFLVGSVYGRMNYEELDSFAGLPMSEDGVVNILLIGNDSRENGEDGRSDAMILISISSKTKKIYMTSLLRDMYVEIPGHDGNRLNAAYSYGGAELLMETVKENLDIPVNRYIQVNFEAFANLIDAVDGVDLELTTEELELVNGYLMEYNMLTNRPQGTDNMDTTQPGLVHLNGPQALAYCRNRYIGTDFGRTERQRKVLTAAIQKLPAALGTNSRELFDGLMPNLTTNLTQNECYRLSLMAGKLLTYDIVSDNIPQPGTYRDATIRSMAVLEVDFDANIKYLREKIYGETQK